MAALARLEQLRCEAQACEACVRRRARGEGARLRRAAHARGALSALVSATLFLAFSAVALAMGLATAGGVAYVLIRGASTSSGVVSLGVAAGLLAGWQLLRKMAARVWPERERAWPLFVAVLLVVFSLVPLVLAGLAALTWQPPDIH